MAEATKTETPEQKPLTVADLKNMAHNYQVPMSDETIKQVAGEGAVDPTKAKAFEQYLQTAAQGLYPTFAPQIKAGIPTAYLLDPYRQVGKQVLGDQFEPDFVGNSAHAKALSGAIDPQTGRPAPMSLDQWKQHLKTDESFGWSETPDGKAATSKVLQAIHNGFSEGAM